jgi:hypothetical protein
MRIRALLASAVIAATGLGAFAPIAVAMTDDGEETEAVRLADLPGSDDLPNTQIWKQIVELGGLEGFNQRALTIFVPSDAAFESLPADALSKLLELDQRDRRRAFLAGSATDTRISVRELAGKRVLIRTLDGRSVTIDATGEELVVGHAEAIDVRSLHDGRVIFVLDEASIEGPR